MAEHIGVNLSIGADDFTYGEFYNKGGQFAAVKLFGRELPGLLEELNQSLTE